METKDDAIAQAGADEAEETITVTASDAGEVALEVIEPSFIGGFESFDEVRSFADGGDGEGMPLVDGDLCVVNDGLVRYEGGAFKVVLSNIVDEYALPADHTERFAADLAELERIVLAADFESGPLLGSVRDVIIALFKGRPKGWSEMSKLEQRDLAKQIEGQAKTIIRKIVRVVAEGPEISVHGKLERYTHAGSFDLKISAVSDEEAALQLFRMQGHEVIIRSADSERFVNGVDEVEGEDDQRPLPFADPEEEREEYVAPADDSDLAGDADEDELEEGDEVVAELSDEDVALVAIDGDELEGDGSGEALPPIEEEGAGTEQLEEEPLEQYAGRSPEPSEEDPLAVAAERDASPPASDFDEATDDELAAQRARASVAAAQRAADYTGPKMPDEAIPGESWHNTADDRVKWKHPNGKWYVGEPDADAVAAWKRDNLPPPPAAPADDEAFPDEPAA
jgi:hypothetical protein